MGVGYVCYKFVIFILYIGVDFGFDGICEI